MMVASLDLCRKLYRVSRWRVADGHKLYLYYATNGELLYSQKAVMPGNNPTPAYSLGYLLRKLGPSTHIFCDDDGKTWKAQKYYSHTGQLWYTADTPEDAACKLAIELFEQHVLVRLRG